MSKFGIVNLIDKIFVSVSIFLIIFAWINFYLRNLWATFILSLIFSFAIVFILYYFLNKKDEKINLNKKQLEDMNRTLLAFKLAPKSEQLNIIKMAIEKEHEVKSENNKISYIDAFGKHLIILAIDLQKITENDLINLLNKNYKKDIDCFDIICNEHDNINTEFLKNKKINLINSKILYKNYILKSGKELNVDKLNTNITKIKFKDILKNIFTPQKAKTYFICGLVLIFSSIILPYHFYYIIVGSMLMLFAVICKIKPKFDNKN